MEQTFKHVSIFIIFLASLLLWTIAESHLAADYFTFVHGRTVLLCLWSTAVVILFHLLYYFLGRTSGRTVYLSTLAVLVLVSGLIYCDKLVLT